MAKRANKKLVAGLTVTGMIGLTAVAFAMLQYLPGKDPQSWVDRATRLTDQRIRATIRMPCGVTRKRRAWRRWGVGR